MITYLFVSRVRFFSTKIDALFKKNYAQKNGCRKGTVSRSRSNFHLFNQRELGTMPQICFSGPCALFAHFCMIDISVSGFLSD